LPDVFVFRYEGGAPRPELGQLDYQETVRQWDALRGFFEGWFLTPQGEFKVAFNKYESEDDLGVQLETFLRNWLAEKVAGGRIVPRPATKGSPRFGNLECSGPSTPRCSSAAPPTFAGRRTYGAKPVRTARLFR
jgi:hypothetical protein